VIIVLALVPWNVAVTLVTPVLCAMTSFPSASATPGMALLQAE
jgi:hypothetical protein